MTLALRTSLYGMEVLVIGDAITPRDVATMCRCGLALMLRGAGLLVCDVGAVREPDAVLIDALARLQLMARRRGCRVELARADGRLRELLVLMGLQDVLPLGERLGLEPCGRSEQGEHPRYIEEEADPPDRAV